MSIRFWGNCKSSRAATFYSSFWLLHKKLHSGSVGSIQARATDVELDLRLPAFAVGVPSYISLMPALNVIGSHTPAGEYVVDVTVKDPSAPEQLFSYRFVLSGMELRLFTRRNPGGMVALIDNVCFQGPLEPFMDPGRFFSVERNPDAIEPAELVADSDDETSRDESDMEADAESMLAVLRAQQEREQQSESSSHTTPEPSSISPTSSPRAGLVVTSALPTNATTTSLPGSPSRVNRLVVATPSLPRCASSSSSSGGAGLASPLSVLARAMNLRSVQRNCDLQRERSGDALGGASASREASPTTSPRPGAMWVRCGCDVCAMCVRCGCDVCMRALSLAITGVKSIVC